LRALCLREGISTLVIGELATGNLKDREATLADLRRQPRAETGTFEECLHFIERQQLHGLGIGWSDIQLRASARLTHVPLWILDKRLAQTAAQLGILYKP
jgi:predicted nucleic acid-binding protein